MRHIWAASAFCLTSLAGCSGAVVLPQSVNFTAPKGERILNDCYKRTAPPEMLKGISDAHDVCIYFIDADTFPGVQSDPVLAPSKKAEQANFDALGQAGWRPEPDPIAPEYGRRFERPRKDDANCSDYFELRTMDQIVLKRVVELDTSAGGYDGKSWRGYVIDDRLLKACGDDRAVKP